MANSSDFNYARDHSRAAYNLKGQPFWCHSKEDEGRAKENGFTSWKYVQSSWPKTVWNQDGQSKPCGNVDFDDAKNEALLAQMQANGWGTKHVPMSEPRPKVESGPMDLQALAAIMMDQKLLVKRIEELETAVTESDGIRNSLESRVSELEALLTADSAAPAAKAKK